MPSARLQQQFIRLGNAARVNRRTRRSTNWQRYWLLASSYAHPAQHHAGSRLAAWEAEVGRGKRSRLTFLYTGWRFSNSEQRTCWSRIVSINCATGWRQSGCAANVGFSSGTRFRQGRHILRVLYYRPLRNLCPAVHCVVPKPISPGKSSVRNAHK